MTAPDEIGPLSRDVVSQGRRSGPPASSAARLNATAIGGKGAAVS